MPHPPRTESKKKPPLVAIVRKNRFVANKNVRAHKNRKMEMVYVKNGM